MTDERWLVDQVVQVVERLAEPVLGSKTGNAAWKMNVSGVWCCNC
jgi:hypothetical protein